MKAALLLLALAPAVAAPKGPAPGSYGFDWLRPDAAKCVKLDEASLKGLPACEFKREGSFGLADPAFACRKSARSEWLVYANKAACERNLETMKANAP
jgi:hypothetical protein